MVAIAALAGAHVLHAQAVEVGHQRRRGKVRGLERERFSQRSTGARQPSQAPHTRTVLPARSTTVMSAPLITSMQAMSPWLPWQAARASSG
jgi:hypothetical protein